MLHNEARELLVEAYEKTGKAKEVAECFSVDTSTVYRLNRQKKATGSVCILGFTFLKAGLSEQRRLLVPGSTGYRDPSTEKGRICLTINLTGLFYLREHAFRNIKLLQDLIIPL